MIISIILIFLVILGVGLPLVLLISPRQNFAISIGLSFPIGIGIFTLIMFVTNLIGIRFSLLNESLILLLSSVPLLLIAKKRIGRFFKDFVYSFKRNDLSLVEKVIVGALAFLIVSSFVNTFYWPVHIWDSIVLYDFRAHVFANTGFMKDAFINNYYINYPFLTSLAHTIVYLAGGEYPQFIHSLFYLSLGISFFGLLKEFISRKLSFLFTLVLLVTLPLFYHSQLSLTNLPFSVYLSLGAILIYLWDKKKETGYLILSAFLVGLSTWTRSVEPFWLGILIIVFMVSVYRKKVWNFAIFSLMFFPIHEMWKVFQSFIKNTGISTATEISGYFKIVPSLFNMEKWGQVFTYLYKYVVMPWNTIFAAFILAVISALLLKKLRKLFLIFFIVFVLLFVLVLGTFSFSLTVDNWYLIGDAAERLSMLFYPLFVCSIALTFPRPDIN